MHLSRALEEKEVLPRTGFDKDAFAKRDAYVAPNGDLYFKGDQLTLGTPSAGNGNFKYIKTSAATLPASALGVGYGGVSTTGQVSVGGIPINRPRMSGKNAGERFVIFKIDKRGNSKKGFTSYAIISDGVQLYDVEMDEALKAGEIK